VVSLCTCVYVLNPVTAPHLSQIHTSGIALLRIKIICISYRTATPSHHLYTLLSLATCCPPTKRPRTICTGTSARDKSAQITEYLVELQAGAPRCNRLRLFAQAASCLLTLPAQLQAPRPRICLVEMIQSLLWTDTMDTHPTAPADQLANPSSAAAAASSCAPTGPPSTQPTLF